MKTYAKFAVLVVVIIGSLAWLAVGGINESKSYYKEISELQAMSAEESEKRLRVAGDVAKGSIVRKGREVSFTLVPPAGTGTERPQNDLRLNVVYSGIDPLPDTFRDGAQALADGKLGTDGVFRATKIQAKCASKYEAKPGAKPGAPVYESKPSGSKIS